MIESKVNIKINVGDRAYPVGAIYFSVYSTNPSELFGGTWVQLKDRFLLGAGGSYSNGSTGGESEHRLNVNEMPSHTHVQNSHNHSQQPHRHRQVNKYSNGQGSKGAYTYSLNRIAMDGYTDNTTGVNNPATATNQNTGGGQSHNNMPPYLVVHMWKRVA